MTTFDELTLGDALKEVLNNFNRFGATCVVIGTTGLELHGAIPASCTPGDVDVLVFADSGVYEKCNEVLYQLYNEYREKSKSLKDLVGMSLTNKCFIYTTSQEVKANVWLKPINELSDYDLVTMVLDGQLVNTLTIKSMLSHKVSLKRQKDLEFIMRLINSILVRV